MPCARKNILILKAFEAKSTASSYDEDGNCDDKWLHLYLLLLLCMHLLHAAITRELEGCLGGNT
jgi:hypothetical protein